MLGQEKVADKSNEIIAIPALLELLDIANCIITIDAIGCQTDIAQKIVASDADYVLGLKKNQGKLYEVVEILFSNPEEIQALHCSYHIEINKGHGRIEIRVRAPNQIRTNFIFLTLISNSINKTSQQR